MLADGGFWAGGTRQQTPVLPDLQFIGHESLHP